MSRLHEAKVLGICPGCPQGKGEVKKKDKKTYYRDGNYYCSKGHWRRINRPEIIEEENETQGI